jgi:hypothetical protein
MGRFILSTRLVEFQVTGPLSLGAAAPPLSQTWEINNSIFSSQELPEGNPEPMKKYSQKYRRIWRVAMKGPKTNTCILLAGLLVVLAVLISIISGCGSVNTTTGTNTATAPPNDTTSGIYDDTGGQSDDFNVPARVVSESSRLTPQVSGNCEALAPDGWSMTSNSEGTAADMFSSDGTLYAGWGIVPITRSMQAYYGDLYGDPETSLTYLANTIIYQNFGDSGGISLVGSGESFDGYFWMQEFTSGQTRGLMFYRIYPSYGDDYVESVYFAVARADRWSKHGDTVANVAASIRCSSQLRPVESSSVGGSTGSASDDGADGLSNSTYNKELGTEYVHNPETGENFLVSPSTDYVDGPQGYGAYLRNGNDYTKLTPGRSD